MSKDGSWQKTTGNLGNEKYLMFEYVLLVTVTHNERLNARFLFNAYLPTLMARKNERDRKFSSWNLIFTSSVREGNTISP